jgi:hypothetical protein
MMTEKGKCSRYRVYSYVPSLELRSTNYAGSDSEIGVLYDAGTQTRPRSVDCVRLELKSPTIRVILVVIQKCWR